MYHLQLKNKKQRIRIYLIPGNKELMRLQPKPEKEKATTGDRRRERAAGRERSPEGESAGRRERSPEGGGTGGIGDLGFFLCCWLCAIEGRRRKGRAGLGKKRKKEKRVWRVAGLPTPDPNPPLTGRVGSGSTRGSPLPHLTPSEKGHLPVDIARESREATVALTRHSPRSALSLYSVSPLALLFRNSTTR